jgi:hypothetical protein
MSNFAQCNSKFHPSHPNVGITHTKIKTIIIYTSPTHGKKKYTYTKKQKIIKW